MGISITGVRGSNCSQRFHPTFGVRLFSSAHLTFRVAFGREVCGKMGVSGGLMGYAKRLWEEELARITTRQRTRLRGLLHRHGDKGVHYKASESKKLFRVRTKG